MRFSILTAPRTKKNNQEIHYRNGRPYISQGKVYKQYEADCMKLIPGAVRKKIAEPVNICATYFMPTAGKVDLTNLHSALCDVLVAVGVLLDDNCKIVVGMDGSRVCIDRENPRTEVEITEVELCRLET